MAITTPYSGSPTITTAERSFPNAANLTVPGTPTTPITAAGIYAVFIDVMTNMVAGDQFEFKVYEKINGGGSLLIYRTTTPSGLQTQQVIFPALILTEGWDVTAVKISGSDRVIPFSIRRI